MKKDFIPYGCSSSAYIDRARKCLDHDGCEFLFYAAFELRCGIEARAREFLEPHDHVSKSKKKEWKVNKLRAHSVEAFGLDAVVTISFKDIKNGEVVDSFQYRPVSEALQAHWSKLGEYLHALKKWREPCDPYWNYTRENLEEIYRALNEVVGGKLMGPPLLAKKGDKKTININMQFMKGEDDMRRMQQIFETGNEYIVEISIQ